MDLIVRPSTLSGTLTVPGSKSHTIRALLIASFAKGESTIKNPLFSEDTYSCIEACEAFGAKITINENQIYVVGNGGIIPNQNITINVGNSGTTLYLAIALAALGTSAVTFIGDKQIDKRSALPLLKALEELGVSISSNNGCTPITIKGPICSCECSLESPTSQYLSALLLALPLARKKFKVGVLTLNEKPYVKMTLNWLATQLVKIKHKNFSLFTIESKSNQNFYNPINVTIGGDYSSASFFIVAGSLMGNPLILKGLQKKDTQGDKEIISILKKMGAKIKWNYSNGEELLVVAPPRSGILKPIKLDLNNMPDALPILSVAATFANGTSTFYNVAHARLKETDRITCMAQELSKVGVPVSQKPDGLTIEGLAFSENGIANLELLVDPKVKPVRVNGHDDHRIIMALAVLATAGNYPLLIEGCDGAQITYPDFFKTLNQVSQKE